MIPSEMTREEIEARLLEKSVKADTLDDAARVCAEMFSDGEDTISVKQDPDVPWRVVGVEGERFVAGCAEEDDLPFFDSIREALEGIGVKDAPGILVRRPTNSW